MSLVVFHDSPPAQFVDPPLMALRRPIREVARLAVALLIARAAGHASAEESRMLPLELVIRGSTGPAPGRSVPIRNTLASSETGSPASATRSARPEPAIERRQRG